MVADHRYLGTLGPTWFLQVSVLIPSQWGRRGDEYLNTLNPLNESVAGITGQRTMFAAAEFMFLLVRMEWGLKTVMCILHSYRYVCMFIYACVYSQG